MLFRQPANREVADQLAALVEHRRQCDPGDGGNAVRHDARQPLGAAGAADLELAIIGDLQQSHPCGDCAAFGGDVRVRVRTPEAEMVFGLGRRGCEPQGVLEAAIIAEHRMLRLELLVDRRRSQRPRGRQLFVGKADAEAPRIILTDFRIRVGKRGPVAVTRDVHRPDIGARVAVDDPMRQRQSNAAALTESGHDAARHPEVLQSLDRTEQRIAVGREGERAVHHPLDAGVAHRREMRETDLE